MSSHMAWQPVVVQPIGGSIGTNLKQHLAKFVVGHGDAWMDLYDMNLGREVRPFLMGYIAGGGMDSAQAQEMLDAIDDHGAVRVVRA